MFNRRVTRAVSLVRQNLHAVMPVAYLIVLGLTYIYYGALFQFSLGVLALCLLPITLVLGRTKQFMKEWTPFLVLLLSYEALQGLAGAFASNKMIRPLYQYDTMVWGFNLTGWVQNFFFSPSITQIASFLYSLHFPLVGVCSVLFWYKSKSNFERYMLALVFTSYVSLVFYILIPTAPPWYSGAAMDLVGRTASSAPLVNLGANPISAFVSDINGLTKLIESDKYAAFPSLHGAYVMLFCYFTVRLKTSYAWIAVPLTGGVLFSTLYLGQHYAIDLIAGGVVAVASVILSEKMLKRQKLVAPNIAATA